MDAKLAQELIRKGLRKGWWENEFKGWSVEEILQSSPILPKNIF